MSSTRLAAGNFNLLARAAAVTLTTGTSDTNFPLTNLYDGLPGKPWWGGAAAASFVVKVDGDLLGAYGDFEAWTSATVPTYWTRILSGTGTVDREATTIHGGTYACKLTPGGGGTSAVYRDLTARAGETLTLSCWLRGAASGTISAFIQDRTTGYYWTGSAWQAASVAWATRSTASYAQSSTTITVQALSIIEADTTTLRITFSSPGTAASYVDDVTCYPSVDIAAFFGHAFAQGRWTITVASSDDAAAWTDRMTPTIAQPAFYSWLSSPVAARYWRLTLADAVASDVPKLGEFVLAQTVALAQRPLYGLQVDEALTQDRQSTPGGATYVAAIGGQPVRVLRVSFRHSSLASMAAFRAEMRRARYGVSPVLIVPSDDEDAVLLSVPVEGMSSTRSTPAVQDTDFAFVGLPGPETGL